MLSLVQLSPSLLPLFCYALDPNPCVPSVRNINISHFPVSEISIYRTSQYKKKPLPPGIKCVPDYLMKLLKCGCQTDEACKSNRCGCSSKSMPCTMFCACEGAEGCHNPFKKPEVCDDPNDMDCLIIFFIHEEMTNN